MNDQTLLVNVDDPSGSVNRTEREKFFKTEIICYATCPKNISQKATLTLYYQQSIIASRLKPGTSTLANHQRP
jgi:hypothetical protein